MGWLGLAFRLDFYRLAVVEIKILGLWKRHSLVVFPTLSLVCSLVVLGTGKQAYLVDSLGLGLVDFPLDFLAGLVVYYLQGKGNLALETAQIIVFDGLIDKALIGLQGNARRIQSHCKG